MKFVPGDVIVFKESQYVYGSNLYLTIASEHEPLLIVAIDEINHILRVIVPHDGFIGWINSDGAKVIA